MIHVFLKSSWNSIEAAPKDPILDVTEAFLADPSLDKVNVGVVSFDAILFFLFFCFEFSDNIDEDWKLID